MVQAFPPQRQGQTGGPGDQHGRANEVELLGELLLVGQMGGLPVRDLQEGE